MTNYRINNMCSIHNKPEFQYCFTCGSRLIQKDVMDFWTCSKDSIHLKIWIDKNGKDPDPDNDCINELEFDI